MSKEVTIPEHHELPAVQNLDRPMTAREVINQSLIVQQILDEVMVEGVHYGTIPGTPKPTLYQPGAEKLCVTFRLAPKFSIEDLSDPDADVFRYRSTCSLYTIRDGLFVGAAAGEASTNEEKYMWRKAVCREEWEDTEVNRRRKKFLDDGGFIEQVRRNAADLSNTVLKMCNKRAFVSAARGATGASDILDVDLEDEAVADVMGAERADHKRAKPKAKARTKQAPTLPYGPSKGKAVNDPAVPIEHLKQMLSAKRNELANPNREQKYDGGNKSMIGVLEAEISARELKQPSQDPEKKSNPQPVDKPVDSAPKKAGNKGSEPVVSESQWCDMLVFFTEESMNSYTKAMVEFNVSKSNEVLPEDRRRFYDRVIELGKDEK